MGEKNEHRHVETNGIAGMMSDHTATHDVITVAGK
jgi:hypothetical protein